MTKKICAVTMLRNDEFFLRKWVDYYGACLGKENLFVCFDGEDQIVPSFCDGVNVRKFPHRDVPVKEGDKIRIGIVSDWVSELFKRYDIVIGGDVDEFLIPDPLTGKSLSQMLSALADSHPAWTTISGLGIDVGQDLSCEEAIREDDRMLAQRGKAKLSTRYSKASVLFKPARWGSGYHRVKGHNFHIVKDLYLFHFGCVDLDRIKAKMADVELDSEGWTRHLKKRAETIYLCSGSKVADWEKAIPFARCIQNIFRPPYAWNKPSMFEAEIVVRIPERFRDSI